MKILSETGLSLDRLAGFIEVADAGSIAAVASGDFSRQALLSRQIKELEVFFAVKLTRRVGRGIELTDAGQELARRTRESFRLLEEYREGYAGRKRKLKIGAAGSVLEWLLIPGLRDVGPLNYDLMLSSGRTGDLVQQLEDGRLDLILVRDDAPTPSMHIHSLGKVGYRLWLPKRMAKKHQIEDAKLFNGLPLALPTGGTFRSQLSQAAEAAGIELDVRVETTSFAQTLEAIRSGIYAGFLPDYPDLPLSGYQAISHPMKWLDQVFRKLVVASMKSRADLEVTRKSISEHLFASNHRD